MANELDEALMNQPGNEDVHSSQDGQNDFSPQQPKEDHEKEDPEADGDSEDEEDNPDPKQISKKEAAIPKVEIPTSVPEVKTQTKKEAVPKLNIPSKKEETKKSAAVKKEGAPVNKEVKNDYYDEAMDISGSQSVESEKDVKTENAQVKQPPVPKPPTKVQQLGTDDTGPKPPIMQPVGYNPSDYANLNVGTEITELFQYITRFKPQPIELDAKLKPFIPEFIPAVGEVDAFLKIPRPDGVIETLGLMQLDEPTLNPSDPSVLEIQYTQWHKKKSAAPISVRSIENAERNPKEVQQWINNINELHKSRPPQTVQYSKQMPDIEQLMQEWPSEMESVLEQVPFPNGDLKISLEEYVRIICGMLDIPVHKLSNSKSLVEALHVVFTLYLEFKQNPHFQKGIKQELEKPVAEQVDYLKIS